MQHPMGPLGMWEILVIIGVIVVVAVTVRLAVTFSRRARRNVLVQQAIEANQPEVAMQLLRTQWSQTSLLGFIVAGTGLALLAALVWHPNTLAGVLPAAAALLCAGTPMALFGYLQVRAEGRPGAVAWAVPTIGSIAAAAAVFGVGGRVQFGAVPSAQEVREFRRTVHKMIGAPPGTASPLIDGHRAEPCLTGSNYSTQACGTRYHEGVQFTTPQAGYLNVYYIPDTDQYLVIGKARVTPAGVIVENGFISAQEALGQTGGKAP